MEAALGALTLENLYEAMLHTLFCGQCSRAYQRADRMRERLIEEVMAALGEGK